MTSKEQYRTAVVAERTEIENLSSYVSQQSTRRRFEKPQNLKTYQVLTLTNVSNRSKRECRKKLPYHFLQADLGLLLGPSGSKLIANTWSKFHLRPTEQNPTVLRPALMKLFSVAARIAAPRGVGHALKRIVSDFERLYFPVVATTPASEHKKRARRFALLSVLQSGQGGHLLQGILGESESLSEPEAPAPESYPSRHIEQDAVAARRRFLFEAAYRAKSWSEAYRQARLLLPSLKASGTSRSGFESRLLETCNHLLQNDYNRSKKKQVFADLATCSRANPEHRLSYALRALSSQAEVCRPGHIEEFVCELLPSNDLQSRLSLNRLYRHKAVSERWNSDLRRLCQSEPSIRNLCRTILATLNYPKARAQSTLERYRLEQPCQRSSPTLTRARLDRVRAEVDVWLSILPPPPCQSYSEGGLLRISRQLWEVITQVCHSLAEEVPIRARINIQESPVVVLERASTRWLSVNPGFLALAESEQKMLLARALFRHAAGLDDLERRASTFTQPQGALQRGLEYAEWCGYDYSPLDQIHSSNIDSNEAIVALEEMYWQTRDSHFQRLAATLSRGCWCPLFDREADLFASSYVDVVSASYALLQAAAPTHRLKQTCTREGLSALLEVADDFPALCLRLQTLWFATIDEQQKRQRPSATK